MGQQVQNIRTLASTDDAKAEFSRAVLSGLSADPKNLPCRYFYDERGSALFQEIMEQPEYYLTGCEIEILQTHSGSISSLVGADFDLVELGAGDGKKTGILIAELLRRRRRFRYVPIDISESAMAWLHDRLLLRFPELQFEGVVSEYSEGLLKLAQNRRPMLVLLLGANIGNFETLQAREFLKAIRQRMSLGDQMIIGFDLKKEIGQMVRAYNDARNVTSRFNLNLLVRINRELGGRFDLEAFRYYSYYDVFRGAVRSSLVSVKRQQVTVEALGRSFSFRAGEAIHTEDSHKYSEEEVADLAEATGFTVRANYYDRRRYFVDSLWIVR
jgi:L-histidine Nalpha-methyltransferase